MIRIVVLGAGFASVNLAQTLSKLTKSHQYVEIVLVNEHNYFVFQPMLPLVAAAAIEANHIVTPIRSLCPKVKFHKGTVHEIDLKNKRVKVIGSEYSQQQYLDYDELVVGMGTAVNLGGIPGLKEHSIPIKSLGDAFYIRSEVINKLETASVIDDPELKASLLTFTVIGGGFSGIETVGQLLDMFRSALKQYPSIDMSEIKMVLVHSKSRILNELEEKLALYAQKKLISKGIQMCLGVRVQEATPSQVKLSDGTILNTRTVIAAIGTTTHAVIKGLPCINEFGKLETNEFFQVLEKNKQGHKSIVPNLWSFGDCAHVPDLVTGSGQFYGPTAQVAVRQGKVAASNIWNFLRDKPMKPFKFKPIGQMVNIGHLSAVAQISKVCFSGIFAYMIWRLIYWLKLPSIQCRLKVIVDWISRVLFSTDITQLDVFRTESLDYANYSEGNFIFKEGDISDYFYIIESGTVQILKEDANGNQKIICELADGDSFGEMGLMEQAPRSASILCKTSVKVIKIDRKSFQDLNKSYSSLNKELKSKVQKIHEENKVFDQEPGLDSGLVDDSHFEDMPVQVDHQVTQVQYEDENWVLEEIEPNLETNEDLLSLLIFC